MGVVVPAREEAGVVGACIASIRHSLGRCGRADLRRAWIVLVADRCTDATAEVAGAALGPAGDVLELSVGNVGTARRAGVDHLLRCLGEVPRERIWLGSTDADTVVPPTWVHAHLALARVGAAAVAGIVRVDSFAEHGSVVAARHRAGYVVHGDGSHPHVHGANLGVRADAYLDAGGWTDHETGEDHDLWERVGARGWPRVSAIDPCVTTSGRRHGRAPDGFAGHLAALATPPVEAPPVEVTP